MNSIRLFFVAIGALSAWLPLAPVPAAAQQDEAPAAESAPEREPKLERSLSEPANNQSFVIDRIVAIVNEQVITQQELQVRIGIVTQQLQKAGTQLPSRTVLSRQILDRMIVDSVQIQLAKETGLRIDDAQLDRALQRIADENKMGLVDFRAALEQDGVNFAKFRDDIRTEMLLARLREREVDTKVVVSESDVDTQLEQEAKRDTPDEEYSLAHILVQIPEKASSEQIELQRKKAQSALQAIRSGGDFAQVSASYSDAAEALQGGNLGWRAAARLPNLFAETLAKLNKGQVSEILRSPNGFHILKLLDKRGKDVAQVINQTKARHILIKVNEIVTDNDAKARITQLKERLENRGDFTALAKQFSEDPSAPNGGELGWISPGDTVPEFEQVMEALDTNKLSDPVRTPFGWHLIEVLERRTQDVTQERTRLAARQGVRQRKADEAYLDWLRQLRDQAYVEYRLDEK